MTDLEKQTLIQYQTESHIRTMILTMPQIADCAVTLNVPQEEPSGKETKTGVSVVLQIVGNATLTTEEKNAVANIVIGAVEGLDEKNLFISDTNMNLYPIDG